MSPPRPTCGIVRSFMSGRTAPTFLTFPLRLDATRYFARARPTVYETLSDDDFLSLIRQLGCVDDYRFAGHDYYIVDNGITDYTFELDESQIHLAGRFSIRALGPMHEGWSTIQLIAQPPEVTPQIAA